MAVKPYYTVWCAALVGRCDVGDLQVFGQENFVRGKWVACSSFNPLTLMTGVENGRNKRGKGDTMMQHRA